jgi:bacterioferritin-associated ferredoxin
MVMEHRPEVQSLDLRKQLGPIENLRVGWKSCYSTMRLEAHEGLDNGLVFGGGRSGTYTCALGVEMTPGSGLHKFEFDGLQMSNGAIGIATKDQPLGTSPTQYNSTFMIYFWLNGDAFCYCKAKSRQTFRFATYKAGDTVRFILDRTEAEKTPLTVEINGKEVYKFDSLEGVGMPKGTSLCPYGYLQYNDKLSLLHTKRSRRPYAVGDSQLVTLLKTCSRLLPDTLQSEEKGDEFCEAVAQHHAKVTSLSLRECRAVTDEGIEKLIAGCKSLTTIDLTECDGVTEKGLAAIAAVCKVVQDPPKENKDKKTKMPPKTKMNKKKTGGSQLFDSGSDSDDHDW